MTQMDTLGKTIQSRRKAQKGLTTTKLAGRVGIAQAYYSRIENDKKIPSPEVFKKINAALGHSLKLSYLYLIASQPNNNFYFWKSKTIKTEADLIDEVLQESFERYVDGEFAIDGEWISKDEFIKRFISDFSTQETTEDVSKWIDKLCKIKDSLGLMSFEVRKKIIKTIT